MKICLATDLHFRASKPASRLDPDYLQTLLNKVKAIKDISADCDVMLLGGDIFNRPDTVHSVLIRVNRAFSEFKIPIYSVVGNHDIFGYEGLTVDTTVIGSLFEMGVVKRLDYLEIPASGRNPVVRIYGMHAFDPDTEESDWRVPDTDGIKVLVSHKMITDTPFPGEACFLLEEIAQKTNADIILSGDMHTPHARKIGRHLFINPGSMARQSIDDRDRYPQVAIITIEDGEIDYEFQTLSDRPAETIFNLTAYNNHMVSEVHTKDFIKTYAHAVFSVKGEASKIGDQFLKAMERDNLADYLRRGGIEYLARAEKETLREAKE